MELQITQEYLGFATHLVYLAPLFEEVLRRRHARDGATARPWRRWSTAPCTATGRRASRASPTSGRTATGAARSSPAPTGTPSAAWPGTTSCRRRRIADEWVRMTFGNDPAFVRPVTEMMLGSREAAVDYMTPLGLHHLMARDHHYGPGPWVSDGPRADWTSRLLPPGRREGHRLRPHRDRQQRGRPVLPARGRASSASSRRCPETYLLWFHHVPLGPPAWPRVARSGRSWSATTTAASTPCAACRPPGSRSRAGSTPSGTTQVRAFLAIQEKEARWWRDACVLYFQTFSGRPIPDGYERPEHDLAHYMAIRKRYVPGS